MTQTTTTKENKNKLSISCKSPGLFGTPRTFWDLRDYLEPLDLFGTPWTFLGQHKYLGPKNYLRPNNYLGPPDLFGTPLTICDP